MGENLLLLFLILEKGESEVVLSMGGDTGETVTIESPRDAMNGPLRWLEVEGVTVDWPKDPMLEGVEGRGVVEGVKMLSTLWLLFLGLVQGRGDKPCFSELRGEKFASKFKVRGEKVARASNGSVLQMFKLSHVPMSSFSSSTCL